ncbi:hypothetical protein EYF80_003780 [Liparis tanakae]|uniref:Uncharacterized protein n=1 Tax=Liparis tanakae TaxID=230148 RepID=A0A4Z2J6X0_9TELE|nr:hypothetical protein EYF80_003780 [Liparis tanakae]
MLDSLWSPQRSALSDGVQEASQSTGQRSLAEVTAASGKNYFLSEKQSHAVKPSDMESPSCLNYPPTPNSLTPDQSLGRPRHTQWISQEGMPDTRRAPTFPAKTTITHDADDESKNKIPPSLSLEWARSKQFVVETESWRGAAEADRPGQLGVDLM